MPTRFLHTADWQLGKPYGTMEDAEKAPTETVNFSSESTVDRVYVDDI